MRRPETRSTGLKESYGFDDVCMTKTGIIILNWNRQHDTIECLKSLDRLRLPSEHELKIYVVDNGSTDESVKSFSKLTSPSFSLIENQANLGYVGGNNVGIVTALSEGCDWVVVLNNDTLVDRNLLVNFAKLIKDNPKIDIVSPKIYFAPGFEFHKDRYPKSLLGRVIWYAGGKVDWNNCYGQNLGVDDVDRGQFDRECEIDFATGTCLVINKSVFKKIGLFEAKYYLYFEDVDFCLRAKRAGFKIIYTPKLWLWHKVAQSSAIGSNLNEYYLTRNRLFFGMRYAPLRTRVALVRESLRFLVRGRKWQRLGVRDYYLRRLGKGSWK